MIRMRIKSIPSALSFSVASYVAMGIALIQGLLLSRILGPEMLGIWLSLMLVVTYGQYFHLGIVNAVNRKIPIYLGQKCSLEAQEYADFASGLLLLYSAAWLVISSALSITIFRAHITGAIVVCVVALAEVWYQLYSTFAKTHQRFAVVGLMNVGRAGCTLLMLPLVQHWSLPGLYFRAILVAAGSVAVAAAVSPVRLRPRLRRGLSSDMLGEGLPLLLVGMVFAVQISVDRLLIASLLGPGPLGEYSLATMLLSVMIVVPGVVGMTSYPNMLQQYGAAGDCSILRDQVRRQTVSILFVSGLVSALALVMVGPLVRMLLPAYVAGIGAAKWSLPGIAILAASMPSSYFLQAVRRQRAHLIVSLSSLGLQMLVILLVVRGGGGIQVVAAATSGAYLLYGAALFAGFWHYSAGGRSFSALE